MSYLDALLGRQFDDGVELELRGGQNWTGGIGATENASQNRTDIKLRWGVVGRTVYVATDGRIDNLADAITAASALSPAEDAPVAVVVVDGGEYEAAGLTIPSWVRVHAPYARVVGTSSAIGYTIQLSADSELDVFSLEPLAGKGGVLAANTAGIKRFRARKVVCSGSGGYGGANLGGAGGVLYYDVDETRVGASAIGVGDISFGTGHMHVRCGDIYLEGESATGVARSGSGYTLITVQHVLESGSHIGTVAFNCAGGNIDGFAISVSADTDTTGAGATKILLPDGTNL